MVPGKAFWSCPSSFVKSNRSFAVNEIIIMIIF
jgi:hypothetical protein